ncbi:hypothetical protein [uncultured Kocuria sp.]|uniref:hypothetical protein n=1 Tax=uncultured Kocuria sp. TaxID=259305 RepID=UPI0026283268|nr:hypothetical protein [uncultured Kocuria sp.]
MWNTFWPDLLVTVIGAALTVAIAFGTYVVQRRVKERLALQKLIAVIHEKRAVEPIVGPQLMSGAGGLEDFQYVSSSILDLRDQIGLAREQVRPESPVQPHLSRMTRACNRYLESSSQRPAGYCYDLVSLREALWVSIKKISELSRSLEALEPGVGARDYDVEQMDLS